MSEVPSWDQAIATVMGPGGPFEIVEKEVGGKKMKVFANTPDSLRECFEASRLHGDKTFLVYEDEIWSFADTMSRVDEIADVLVNRYAIEKGDRVAIAMRNYPEWIMSFAAITSVGGVAVCMNSWWKTDEMAFGLEDCGAKLLICDVERLQTAQPTLERLGVRSMVVRHDGELPSGADRMEDVLRKGANMPEVSIGPDDDVTILYTSGTTGFPKGAVSTQFAVLSSLQCFASRAMVGTLSQPPKEPHPFESCFILAVPLFHVTGLVPVMLSCFLNGIKLVMMYKWTPERALELIEREKVTQFVGVPTMTIDLLESPDFASRDTSSLASVGGGGAPMPPELVGRVDKDFKRARPGLGYGMTETNAYGPQISGDDYIKRPRSTGRSVPVVEVKAFDSDMNELPVGELGELCFKGPNLVRGYWNNPTATAETIVDGWLRSGDLGRVDQEGFVFIEDRVKDMVLRGGENIYCAEVEAIIYEHEDVHEVAVFGMPHDRLGEEVACAVLAKKGRTINVEALTIHLSAKLASFKVPSVIEVATEALPRNAAGKILKRDLRDMLVERKKS
jgi:long-chain acyl-CoA synthetase